MAFFVRKHPLDKNIEEIERLLNCQDLITNFDQFESYSVSILYQDICKIFFKNDKSFKEKALLKKVI